MLASARCCDDAAAAPATASATLPSRRIKAAPVTEPMPKEQAA